MDDTYQLFSSPKRHQIYSTSKRAPKLPHKAFFLRTRKAPTNPCHFLKIGQEAPYSRIKCFRFSAFVPLWSVNRIPHHFINSPRTHPGIGNDSPSLNFETGTDAPHCRQSTRWSDLTPTSRKTRVTLSKGSKARVPKIEPP